jgi:hypothetical protein
LLVSPALKRMFSSSATSPSARPATTALADSPTVSVAKATGLPSSSLIRPTTGAREYFSSGAPLGRPRWAHTTTRAPASDSALMVGTEARIRPSSVMLLVTVEGDVEIRADEDALAAQVAQSAVVFTAPTSFFRCIALELVGSELGADEDAEVHEAVAVAPLVVVPADDLDLVADDLGQPGVEDARRGVGLDVLGHDRVLGVDEALQRADSAAALTIALTSSTVVSRRPRR